MGQRERFDVVRTILLAILYGCLSIPIMAEMLKHRNILLVAKKGQSYPLNFSGWGFQVGLLSFICEEPSNLVFLGTSFMNAPVFKCIELYIVNF